MPRPLRTLCVFCGSNPGNRPVYREVAEEVGRMLAKRRIRIVYGGCNVGLMGVLASSALQAGGHVVGVVPRSMVEREIAYTHLPDLHVVDTMNERKDLMARLSDGFLALPGGFGTLDELFEAVTWTQLGIHNKPCGILNVEGFFSPLLGFLDHAVEEGFLRPANRELILDGPDPAELLDRLAMAEVSYTPKWTVDTWVS